LSKSGGTAVLITSYDCRWWLFKKVYVLRKKLAENVKMKLSFIQNGR